MKNNQQAEILDADRISDAVYDAIGTIACSLRSDYRCALEGSLSSLESAPDKDADSSEGRALDVLRSILDNDDIAKRDHVPICQDTGTVWVCLEFGCDVCVDGSIFSKVDEVVARAYKDNALRMSVVKDAIFDRSNTGDNTPAFCELKPRSGPGATLHVMLKGGGSDNASRVVMCAPGVGRQGVIDEVVACVKEKAANACPPLVLGIGIGSTFDKVAGLAKHALLRPIGTPSKDDATRNLEREIAAHVEALGIGPGALGGSPTALAVHIESAPCHIAALPLAINMGCCAMRSVSIDIL